MVKSINLLALGLITVLGACSAVDTNPNKATLTSAFANTVKGRGVVAPSGDIVALFNPVGEKLIRETYAYTLIEAETEKIGIFSVTVEDNPVKYVVVTAFEHLDSNTGKTHTTVSISTEKFSSLEEAVRLASSIKEGDYLLTRGFTVVGILTGAVDASKIVYNPMNIVYGALKGKTVTINGKPVALVGDYGDLSYEGQTYTVLAATADQATMGASRTFTASYYTGTGSNTKFQFKLTFENLDYIALVNYEGEFNVTGVLGNVKGQITK